jgi:hypothetical protein
LELRKAFAEEPLSVALHPSGLSALVGFSDKLRLLTILMDDFRCDPCQTAIAFTIIQMPMLPHPLLVFLFSSRGTALHAGALVSVYKDW